MGICLPYWASFFRGFIWDIPILIFACVLFWGPILLLLLVLLHHRSSKQVVEGGDDFRWSSRKVLFMIRGVFTKSGEVIIDYSV